MKAPQKKLEKLLALRQLRFDQASMELNVLRQQVTALENRARGMEADRSRLWREFLEAESEQVEARKEEGFGRYDLMDMDIRMSLVQQQKSRMVAAEEAVWSEHRNRLRSTGIAEQRYLERSRKLDALKTLVSRLERKNRIKTTLVAEEADGEY